MAACSAPTLLPSAVDVWRHAIEGIPADKPPCRYLTPAKWAALREAAIDFCDRYGAEAHRLGWTASQLFGVHPQHGTLRVDGCGAMMINGRKATGVDATGVQLSNQTAHRDKPGQETGPPIWEFAAKR
ncbi:hypothetical protein Q8W71_27155 [Methylobacterium sp. NEAU 140]|uniref:hypothetical protein n=1 Tax=Methylobacterium sp. NEAU 140 TaxID=3064945 RepID=UPI002734CABD|nr:hypothetical protein [Methylobacterium sp. NEAU 140]MDP4026306.1 hypothetical protein [Methylobacterium sp. NEAU 140]